MSAPSLDDLDLSIIACLQESGRQTNTQIAAQLKVAESTVRKRIERLVADEVIRITAVANPLKLDYEVIAILGIQAVPSRIAAVADELAKLPEFRFIGITTGVYDFVTEAWFRTLQDLHVFLRDHVWCIEGVTRVDTAHVLDMVRYTYDWGRDLGAASWPNQQATALPLRPR